MDMTCSLYVRIAPTFHFNTFVVRIAALLCGSEPTNIDCLKRLCWDSNPGSPVY